MITPSEEAYITQHAYVPEQLPHYVTTISRTEPFLIGDFVAHMTGNLLIFVGYPLIPPFKEETLLATLNEAKARFEPTTISLLAPALPDSLHEFSQSQADKYYRLDLSLIHIHKKTRNMLTRAYREVTIGIGKFGREHKRLVNEFLDTHRLKNSERFIFQHIPDYAKCESALVFEARNARGDLVAFDIAEFRAQAYAFYMFNFRARKYRVPGVSDLLLANIIEYAQAESKRYVNLGLGINAGITFFKAKWGAEPFASHIASTQESKSLEPWEGLFDQLSRL